jgi:hypothetical protein
MTALATREEELTLGTLDITDTDLYVERGYPWREWICCGGGSGLLVRASGVRALLGDHKVRGHPVHLEAARAVLEPAASAAGAPLPDGLG